MPVCVFFLLDKDIYIFSAIFASALIWLKNVEVLEGTSVPENMEASASNSVNLVSDSNIDWDSDNNDIARFNYCQVANTYSGGLRVALFYMLCAQKLSQMHSRLLGMV